MVKKRAPNTEYGDYLLVTGNDECEATHIVANVYSKEDADNNIHHCDNIDDNDEVVYLYKRVGMYKRPKSDFVYKPDKTE